MKDPFKTRKMHTVPLPATAPAVPEAAPSAPSIPSSGGGRASATALAPPSSDSSWSTGEVTADRTTDPVMTVVPTTGNKDRATLTIISGINAGQVFALDGTDHVIGRGTEADLWLEDGGVSRRHARVTCRSDGKYFVEDIGSTNGTFVNGIRLTRERKLTPGDVVRIGETDLRFEP